MTLNEIIEAIGIEPYYREDAGVIYCADCLDILPRMPEKCVDLVVTDPPYGVNTNTDSTRFSGGHRNSQLQRSQGRVYGSGVVGDNTKFDPSPLMMFENLIIWGFNNFCDRLQPGATLIWIKRLDDAFGSFLSDAEIAWMNKGHGVYCRRDLSLTSITRERQHPTQKPITIMQWCVSFYPNADLIFDPFLGSGTTAVAAKQLGRKFIGIEIEEKYCAIAVQRLAQGVLI